MQRRMRWATRLAVAGLVFATVAAAQPPEQLPAEASGPANLLKAVSDAILSSPQLRARLAELRASQQLIPEARARLYPQLSLFSAADWVHDSVEGDYYGISNIDRSDTYPRYSYGATLRLALYNAPLLLGTDKAEQRLARAKADVERSQDELILKVCDAYFALLAAQDQQQIANARLDALRQQLSQVEGRTASGLALDAELRSAEAGFALAQADQIAARLAVESGYTVLATLTGQQYPALLPLPAEVTLLTPLPDDEGVWLERARSRNPEVLVHQFDLEVAQIEHRQARRSRWPQLDLVGSIYQIDSHGGISGARDESDRRVGVAATLPLFTGGRIAAEIERTYAQQTRAEAELANARGQALREVKLAFLKARVGASRILALKRAVAAARASEAANRAGYEVGTRTNADVLTAVEQRYTAETNFSAARYRFLTDSLHLKGAAGTLLNADLAEVNRLLRAAR